MLMPNPETDLSLSLMYLGSEVMSILSSKKYVYIEEVLMNFLKVDARRNPDLFLDALTFLYSLGIVEHSGYKIKLKNHHDYTQATIF